MWQQYGLHVCMYRIAQIFFFFFCGFMDYTQKSYPKNILSHENFAAIVVYMIRHVQDYSMRACSATYVLIP